MCLCDVSVCHKYPNQVNKCIETENEFFKFSQEHNVTKQNQNNNKTTWLKTILGKKMNLPFSIGIEQLSSPILSQTSPLIMQLSEGIKKIRLEKCKQQKTISFSAQNPCWFCRERFYVDLWLDVVKVWRRIKSKNKSSNYS